MSNNPITVLIIEDHAIVRQGYHRILEQSGEFKVVAETSSGEKGYQLAAEHDPDVIILDLSLPGMSGLETIRRIKARNTQARILVYTMHENSVMAERAMQNGASGYLTKASDMSVMVTAVEQVAAGRKFIDPSIANELALKRVSGESTPLQNLSPREFEIFKLVATGRRTDEIAATLSLTSKTVSNYVSQIKNKLHVGTTAEMVHLAMDYGVLDSLRAS